MEIELRKKRLFLFTGSIIRLWLGSLEAFSILASRKSIDVWKWKLISTQNSHLFEEHGKFLFRHG